MFKIKGKMGKIILAYVTDEDLIFSFYMKKAITNPWEAVYVQFKSLKEEEEDGVGGVGVEDRSLHSCCHRNTRTEEDGEVADLVFVCESP